MSRRKTIALDFDGVLHAYTSPWTTPAEIHDGPVPGAREFVVAVLEHYDVVVFSARAGDPAGLVSIEEWLAKHGFPELPIYLEKPRAQLYIDDRGFRFEGRFPSLAEIQALKPWNRRDTGPALVEPPRHTVRVAVFLALLRFAKGAAMGFDEDIEVLYLLRKNTLHYPGFYGLPSGHLEAGETLLAGVLREAKEEIGIVLPDADLSTVMHRFDSDGLEYLDFLFWSWLPSGQDPVNAEPEKCEGLLWQPLVQRPPKPKIVPHVSRMLHQHVVEQRYGHWGVK